MVLSDEEKRLRRQAYQKNYQKKRYATDAKFKEKQKMRGRAWQKKRLATDPEFKEKHYAYLKKYQKKRYATDAKFKEKQLSYMKKYQKKRLEPDGVNGQAKAEVFAHYSKVLSNSDIPICACCGYSDLRFLSVDHIDGRKNLSVKEKKLGGSNLWKYLIKTGLPSGYQILCHNCNIAKGRGKYCPHQLDKME